MRLQRSTPTEPEAISMPAGTRVQYVGEHYAAYRGLKGELLTPRGPQSIVKFDDIETPVTLPTADLISMRDEYSPDPKALAVSKKPRCRYVANTSGGILIIPDLVSAAEEGGIALDPGEKLDLLQYFTPEQINRSRGLVRALKEISETTKLAQLTVIGSVDDPLPDGAIVKPLVERVSPGTTVEADANVYDRRIDEEYEKENIRNEKLKQGAQRRRHTTQHGRSSRNLGGR